MKNSTNELISSLFNPQKIPEEAISILENFDKIVQDNLPLNSKQLSKLPEDIRELSHQLTDERDTRRLSYMNEKTTLSAYARYFMWWNLVRLTRLFSNIDISKINLKDNDVCIDIGSGPLTIISALWLSRPELRKIKLTWYCLDLSQSSMTLGENIFLSIVAKTTSFVPTNKKESENSSKSITKENQLSYDNQPAQWKIIRVKGGLGTPIKEKAKLITCANMFNEAFQSEQKPLDFLAKKYSTDLFKYSTKNSSFIIVEPGVPRSARFISLLRDNFIRKGLSISAPCCHHELCPMDGRLLKGHHIDKSSTNSNSSKTGKWCNFAFPTKNAPEKLQKLSSLAKLPKDRAVLSFVFSIPTENADLESNKSDENRKLSNQMTIRIASDPIKLSENKIGFYACSPIGLVLYIPKKSQLIFSGDLINTNIPSEKAKIDKKSGARIIECEENKSTFHSKGFDLSKEKKDIKKAPFKSKK